MIIGIIQWVIISLTLIMLIHHLFYFFKKTLTVPKIKDLVIKPSQTYKDIDNRLSVANNNTIKLSSKIETETIDSNEMKTELKNFFNELNQNKLDTISNSQHFSNVPNNMYSEL